MAVMGQWGGQLVQARRHAATLLRHVRWLLTAEDHRDVAQAVALAVWEHVTLGVPLRRAVYREVYGTLRGLGFHYIRGRWIREGWDGGVGRRALTNMRG